MLSRLFVILVSLAFSVKLAAQPASSIVISDREKAAIGVVEVRIINRSDATDTKFERGSGVVVSRQGHVLTAGHVFKDNFAQICRSYADSTTQFRCEISFYPSGDLRQRYIATLESDRVQSADFAVLKLPNSQDVIRQPEWPHVYLARTLLDGEALSMVGYQGSDPITAGDANLFGQQDGRLRNGLATACTTGDGWGLGRELGGKSAEGWSGGPVFNTRHRLVGIVLGRPCPKPGSGGGVFEFDYSRILPVGSMTGLCTNFGMTCEYGFPGDIDRQNGKQPTPWFSRLVNPAESIDQYAYGLRIPDWSKSLSLNAICQTIGQNAPLMEKVRSDSARFGQLATLINARVDMCSNVANFRQSNSWLQLQALADNGYEPAQYVVAGNLLTEIYAQHGMVANTGATPQLSASETLIVAKARRYLEAADRAQWPAATFLLFEQCRQKFIACSRSQMRTYLDSAAQQGQLDALRMQGLFLLAGQKSEIDFEKRYNFSLPQNTQLGLAQLVRAAQPQGGSIEGVPFFAFDNQAAAYLSYLYGGGTYQGKQLVQPDYKSHFDYQVGCLGGFGQVPMANNPLHAFCMFSAELGQFYFNQPGNRASVWSRLKTTLPVVGLYHQLSKNIVSWSTDPTGADLESINCAVASDFSFTAPATRPTPKPKSANCYFGQ